MSKGGGVSNGINFASSDLDIYPTLRLGARGAALLFVCFTCSDDMGMKELAGVKTGKIYSINCLDGLGSTPTGSSYDSC